MCAFITERVAGITFYATKSDVKLSTFIQTTKKLAYFFSFFYIFSTFYSRFQNPQKQNHPTYTAHYKYFTAQQKHADTIFKKKLIHFFTLQLLKICKNARNNKSRPQTGAARAYIYNKVCIYRSIPSRPIRSASLSKLGVKTPRPKLLSISARDQKRPPSNSSEGSITPS